MKFLYALIILICLAAGWVWYKDRYIVYCPSASKVIDTIKDNKSFVDVSIGRWKISLLDDSKNFKFLKASYISGESACYYGESLNNVSVKLTPRVNPELFPDWNGASGKVRQLTVPDCKEKIKKCRWRYIPLNLDQN